MRHVPLNSPWQRERRLIPPLSGGSSRCFTRSTATAERVAAPRRRRTISAQGDRRVVGLSTFGIGQSVQPRFTTCSAQMSFATFAIPYDGHEREVEAGRDAQDAVPHRRDCAREQQRSEQERARRPSRGGGRGARPEARRAPSTARSGTAGRAAARRRGRSRARPPATAARGRARRLRRRSAPSHRAAAGSTGAVAQRERREHERDQHADRAERVDRPRVEIRLVDDAGPEDGRAEDGADDGGGDRQDDPSRGRRGTRAPRSRRARPGSSSRRARGSDRRRGRCRTRGTARAPAGAST